MKSKACFWLFVFTAIFFTSYLFDLEPISTLFNSQEKSPSDTLPPPEGEGEGEGKEDEEKLLEQQIPSPKQEQQQQQQQQKPPPQSKPPIPQSPKQSIQPPQPSDVPLGKRKLTFAEVYDGGCFKDTPKFQDVCLPYLNIMGVKKCGTTSIFFYLSHHPNIVGQNPHFPFSEGIEAYAKQLLPVAGLKLVNMDKGPSTYPNLDLAKRMHEMVPNMKLIFMFRNPIDRLYSNYWMFVRDTIDQDPNAQVPDLNLYVYEGISGIINCTNQQTSSAIDCFRPENKKYVNQHLAYGIYADILDIYEHFYDKSQLFPIISEDLRSMEKKKRGVDQTFSIFGLTQL